MMRSLAASFAAVSGSALTQACTPVDESGRTVVSLWFAYGGKNREELLALVTDFNASQTAVRVVPTYQGDYFEALAKLRTAIGANAAPALTHVIGEVLPYLAEAGALAPLDRFAPASSFELVSAIAQSGSYFGGADRPLWGLPFNRSTPIAYINGNVLNELGVHPPSTWEELRTFAKNATRRNADDSVSRWGFECPVDWWFWAAMVGQAGANVIEPNGDISLGGEAGVKALRFWQTLVHEDRTMKPPPGRDYNSWQVTNGDFLAERSAMIWTSTAFLRYLENNAKFPVIAAPLPRDVRRSVPIGGTLFVMPRGNPERVERAAHQFLTWMMAPEQANRWATRTGYLPVSRAGLEKLRSSGYYEQHPNDGVAVEQLTVATAWPWSTELFRVQREAVQPRLEEAVLAQKDAASVLEAARVTAREP
ncbi:MAG: ABC transporter substrate-binding protein [Polyangiaceae bacterium]|nr:ABC transporter substrate-binding protein [Polyangiaceae bacterium]